MEYLILTAVVAMGLGAGYQMLGGAIASESIEVGDAIRTLSSEPERSPSFKQFSSAEDKATPSPPPMPIPGPPPPIRESNGPSSEHQQSSGLTSEHQQLRARPEIPHGEVGTWRVLDAVWWKTLGGDDYLNGYRDEWVHDYQEVIKTAAAENDIPPELLAGVAWKEVGAMPDLADDLLLIGRDDAGDLTTSVAPMSLQLGTAAELLGYDFKNMSSAQANEVVESLRDPQQAIFLAARYLSNMRDIDFKGTGADELTDEQQMVIAARYNRGPSRSLEDLKNGKLNYGRGIVENRPRMLHNLGLPVPAEFVPPEGP